MSDADAYVREWAAKGHSETRCTPARWAELTGIRVLDPDGWREDDKPWTDAVTLDEFKRRAARSTVQMPRFAR